MNVVSYSKIIYIIINKKTYIISVKDSNFVLLTSRKTPRKGDNSNESCKTYDNYKATKYKSFR